MSMVRIELSSLALGNITQDNQTTGARTALVGEGRDAQIEGARHPLYRKDNLLMGLCDRIYAMEAGQVIAEGTPDEIRSDPRVVASYLGTKDAAITRSGVKEFARRD